MFDGCENIKTIKLPEKTTIGKYAFNNCHSLTALELSKKVTEIGINAFGRTYLLQEIVTPNNFNYYFGDDTYVFNKGFVKPKE